MKDVKIAMNKRFQTNCNTQRAAATEKKKWNKSP